MDEKVFLLEIVELFENSPNPKLWSSLNIYQFGLAGDEDKNIKYTGRIFFIDGSKRH